MTSPDGINWTIRTSDNYNWYSVAYGNGLWVSVAAFGIMTSPNGINWTIRMNPVDNYWNSVAYGNGLWVAVSETGLRTQVMTSPDGINWTIRMNPVDNQWKSVSYGNGLWVAVAASGNGNRVMISSANSINIVGAGSSIITATQAATNIYSSKTISATFTTPTPSPPDYSVTQFSQFLGFELRQYGKYATGVRFRTSSVGGSYGHKVVFYPTSSPATKTFVTAYSANGTRPEFYVTPLEAGTDYTVAVTLVNMNTGEELTHLQSVQTITFTTPTPSPPDYSVKDLQPIGEFSLLQSGQYMYAVRFTHSSVGGIYGHKLSFYPTSNPANETVMFTINADGSTDNHALIPLESATNYTAAVKLVNEHTGEELTHLQSVQTITFTTPTPPPPPPDYSIQYFERRDGDLTLISEGIYRIYRGVYGFLAAGLNSVYVNNITYNRVSDPSTVYVVGSYIANGGFNLVNLEPLIIGEYYQLRVKAALRSTGVEVPNFEQIINFQV
jgi:hypothetical protein